MSVPEIHPQLLRDCHYLGTLPATALLLHRNASLPWFILVPDTRMEDYLDLPAEHGGAVLADCTAVSAFIKNVLGFEKVNFAGLGNLVPQMHLHVIGRSRLDPCWPQPVWGNLEDGAHYAPEQLQEWQSVLVRMLKLEPAQTED
ncbi:HIT domain-containing protein [Pseudohalioglobus lutimaris]|uniref:HIT domain-containing protein n=1 Tax=Pseudohalioglobus lutimaris TaxID=1737061 RepID=A0A2N5X3Z1_9GAMM|nr:HIT domain-containing protein [Pseudohalioglobus lutimaris]PLW69211.1 HIT domain-containing protein [Pseudohalioglobus lutimaris]